jgi:hypothetical protein
MYNKLPAKASIELCFDYPDNPMTLNVVALEVKNDTDMGKRILARLGYQDVM